MFYTVHKVSQLFQSSPDQDLLVLKEKVKNAQVNPTCTRGGRQGFSSEDLADLGTHFGFMPRPQKPRVFTHFVTKGGVLKTSMTLNMARMAAVHGIKTLVIGLDMQCDITTALGYEAEPQSDNLEEALLHADDTLGLHDFFMKRASLPDLIQETDLPHLFFIPETPELVAMDQHLMQRPRREYWLKEKVIEPLKESFDLIVIDCSPNWNQLITNALVATDVLVSPLECKINNYRNFRMFRAFISEFKEEMQLQFEHFFVPTRYARNRKLSREIREWYLNHVDGCLRTAIKDSTQGEEATAMHLSVPEYAPGSSAALEMNQVLAKLWNSPSSIDEKRKQTTSYSSPENRGMMGLSPEV